VIKPGRSFLKRLIDLSKVAKRPNHHIRLNLDARSGIELVHVVVQIRVILEWSIHVLGIMKSAPRCSAYRTSDASGKWGCRAFYDRQCHWFQLIPIVLAAAIWGREWSGLTVQAQCDNAAVVTDLNQDCSKNADVMHLLRSSAFIKAKFIVASHIPGKDSHLADALSRDNHSYFLSNHPLASKSPSPLSQELLDGHTTPKAPWHAGYVLYELLVVVVTYCKG
jgi:hypothetical protein